MAFILADRVKETTAVTGTGTATLLGAVTGFQSFAAIGNNNITYYCIADQSGSNWEVGIGTYTASGTTLTRTTVYASSNAGALVSFAAGTKDVYCTYPAEKSVNKRTADSSVALDAGAALILQGGTSGSATIVAPAAAGTPTLTLPTTTGTLAIVESPIAAWNVYSSSNQAILASSGATLVQFPLIEYDVGNSILTTSVAVPPIAGYYAVTATVALTVPQDVAVTTYLIIRKNGVNYSLIQISASTDPGSLGYAVQSISKTLFCNGVSDSISIFINNSANCIINGSAGIAYVNFSGVLID